MIFKCSNLLIEFNLIDDSHFSISNVKNLPESLEIDSLLKQEELNKVLKCFVMMVVMVVKRDLLNYQILIELMKLFDFPNIESIVS